MTLADWPDEPCDECRDACERQTGIRPSTATEATFRGVGHTLNVFEALARVAGVVHGGSAGREMAEDYERAAAALRRIWRVE